MFGKDISNELYIINKAQNKKENIINVNIIKNNNEKNNFANDNYNLVLKNKNDENSQNNCNDNKKQNNDIILKKNDIKRNEGVKIELIKNEISYNKNPLEEYDELIMKNLFIDEIKNRADYKKLSLNFSEKDNINRFSCLNLLIIICEKFGFRQETFYLTINIFDRYLQYLKLSKKLETININLILLTCIFIASKYEVIYPPFLYEYSEFFHFSKDEILKTEYNILNTLNFELHICSPYLFLTKFFNTMEKNESIQVLYGAQFILDLCLISLEFCIYKPSLQASICLYLSKKIINNRIYKKLLWSHNNEYITGYSENEIKKNLKIPLKLIKDFFTNYIIKDFTKTALYKKFSSPKYSNIAIIIKDLFKK